MAKARKKTVAPSDKLNIIGIGIGGKGASDLRAVESQNIIALCDTDWAYAKHIFERYPDAIYHLQKYLDLCGETLSKQDQADIRRYIQDCERLMFESYRVRNDIKLADDVPQTDPAKLAGKDAEIAALREKLRKYIEHEEIILAQNKELRDRNDRLTRAASATAAATRAQIAMCSCTLGSFQ